MEQQKAATKRRKEQEAAAKRADTAARRKAERELKEAELASIKKNAIQKDNLARASMNQLMNTHIESIHSYYIISPNKVSDIAKINIYEDFIPKSAPVFSKKKAPNLKKAVKDFSFFLIPLLVWLLLVSLNYESGTITDYLVNMYNLITNHQSSGVDTFSNFSFVNILSNLNQSEYSQWNRYEDRKSVV